MLGQSVRCLTINYCSLKVSSSCVKKMINKLSKAALVQFKLIISLRPLLFFKEKGVKSVLLSGGVNKAG